MKKIKDFFAHSGEWVGGIIKRLDIDMNDILVAAGIGLLITGIWQIYRPAAFIAGGLGFIWFGLTGARSRSTK